MAAELPILHRDAALLVVDKPAGLPSQAPRGGGDNAFDRLRGEHAYVGLHHRLDTPASGCLLFTLDRRANAGIAEAFRAHHIRRIYRIAVLGDPGAEGQWDAPIEGKRAVTHWRRLGRQGPKTLLEARLETGRMHQLRRHAAGAGLPILGDRRYGSAAGKLAPRLALHAQALELEHPLTGEALRVVAPPPALLDLEAWG